MNPSDEAPPTQQPDPRSPDAAPRVSPEVISRRKSCTADGVGLSHYILMEESRPK
ncbi:MAG: modified peptide precursor CbpA [Magnetococcales bacterium]|nr:modified peptide precursor CbpA [Magnetococcales bacterium]